MTLSKINKMKNKIVYKDQMVFCVPANVVEHIEEGFLRQNTKNIWSLYDNKGKYMLRAEVEGLCELYQLVPYITVMNAKGEILSIKSKKTGNMSIGFSSHIVPEVCGNNNIISKACFDIVIREFGPFVSTPLNFQGYIKTFTETTKGHLGLLFITIVDPIEVKDTDLFEYKFMKKAELIDVYGKLEKWSKITLNHIVESTE